MRHWLTGATLSLSVSLGAAADPATAPAADKPAAEDAPSAELLEFLGTFEAEDGDWVEPEMLETVDLDNPPPSQDGDDTGNTQ